MWTPKAMAKDLRSVIAVLSLLIIYTDITFGLTIHIEVPLGVRRGDDAHLVCNYNLENDTLYSVKWYKGRKEFYRYLPKENPAMKIFPLAGINVERLQSNASHVLLRAVEPSISGKFSCEVSADAPSFHTELQISYMEVCELPKQVPVITGIQSRYRHGDKIQANCTSFNSKPAANLTWLINDVEAPWNVLRPHPPLKNQTSSLETATLEINLLVTNNHFNNSRGRLKLKCLAKIHDIYEESAERIVEDDSTNVSVMASGSSAHNINSYPSFEHPQDGEPSSDGLYLTHQTSASDSSSARTIMLTTSYLNAFIIYGSILLSIGSLLSLKLHHNS